MRVLQKKRKKSSRVTCLSAYSKIPGKGRSFWITWEALGSPPSHGKPAGNSRGVSWLPPTQQRAGGRGVAGLFGVPNSLLREQHVQNRSRGSRHPIPGETWGQAASVAEGWGAEPGEALVTAGLRNSFLFTCLLLFFSVNYSLYLLNCCFYQQCTPLPALLFP